MNLATFRLVQLCICICNCQYGLQDSTRECQQQRAFISEVRVSSFECLQCLQWIASIPEVTSTSRCVVLVHVRQVALRGGFGEQANKFQTDSSEGEDEGGAVTGVLNAQIVH